MLTFTTIFFEPLPDQFDTFFNPKNAAETNAIKFTPPSIGQLEKRTISRATDVVLTLNFGDNANHSYSHRFKPPTEPHVS